MKKLLSILGAMGMSAMAGATVVACAPQNKKDEIKFTDEEKAILEKVLLGNKEKGEDYDPIAERNDITGIVERDWTYQDFFKMGENPREGNSVLDLFYDAVRILTKASNEDLTDEKVEEFVQNVRTWTQDNVTLGYIGKDKKFDVITAKDAADSTMNELFVEKVKADFPKETEDWGEGTEGADQDPDFWTNPDHAGLTLAIEFGFENDPMYWSFTMII